MNKEAPSFKRELLATLPSLRAFAVSLTGKHDKADDLVQDTVMKAWAKQAGWLGTRWGARFWSYEDQPFEISLV